MKGNIIKAEGDTIMKKKIVLTSKERKKLERFSTTGGTQRQDGQPRENNPRP